MSFDEASHGFDVAPDRRGTHSVKWDAMAARTGAVAPDALAMWVADMDFPAPAVVRERLARAVEHGVFGYYGDDASWRSAATGWSLRRHCWEVDPDWLTPSPGIGAALGMAVRAFSEPGEGVVIFAPVYHVFGQVIRSNGRRPVVSRLRETQGRYEMDLEQLGADLPADARVVLLCSPHNPGGRIWSAQELRALADFCSERDLILVSDEIWRDMIYDGRIHTPTALAAPDVERRLVTFTAPSKTFNLAGLQCAEVTIADPELRARWRTRADADHGMSLPQLGALAAEAAYELGAPWLDALLPYLAANRDRFSAGIASAAPGARAMPMSATYLSWVDFSGTGMTQAEVMRRIAEVARIGVNPGPTFGDGGETRARFNLACPRSTIDEALERLSAAFS